MARWRGSCRWGVARKGAIRRLAPPAGFVQNAAQNFFGDGFSGPLNSSFVQGKGNQLSDFLPVRLNWRLPVGQYNGDSRCCPWWG